MFQIHREQLNAFDRVRLPDFESDMAEHLRDFSPLHSESLGDDGIRILVRMAMERAEKHGFTHRGPVKFYIETVILLGIDFDTDPQYPWAGKILRDSSIPDQTRRADRIHTQLIELLDEAGGPSRQYAREALQRARRVPFRAIPVSRPDFGTQMVQRMRENHPEKADYIGDDRLLTLIPRAIEETRKYSVSTDAGVCLFLGLMFAIGHGFTGDPKYPWVANTLRNPAITNPDKRVERLYSKTMTYLDHVLRHLEGQ